MNTVLSGTIMDNEQVAEELINRALNAHPQFGAPTKQRQVFLFRRFTPWQYDALKKLIAAALDDAEDKSIARFTAHLP